MRKTIIILIILFTKNSYAQQAFADTLLSYEKQIFGCSNDQEKNDLLLKKFNTLLKHHISNERTLNELYRINPELIRDSSEKRDFYWNASLLCFLNNDLNNANVFLNRSNNLIGMSKENLILSMMINSNFDTIRVTHDLTELQKLDPSYSCMSCLNDLVRYTKKHKLFYSISSALVPGSGSMMLGYIIKGLISTSMVAGSAYLLYTLFTEQLYINSFVWGAGLTFKFYIGNIKLTEKLFDQKENKIRNKKAVKCEEKLSILLQKDKIDFKTTTLQ